MHVGMGPRDELAKSIFLDALEIGSEEDRLAHLDRRCGEDVELRAEIETLLRHHARLGDYLEHAALGPLATQEIATRSPGEGPGTVIGPYKLLQEIGEGGMGTVFMAEQAHPVRRKVALKIIKPGMDTKQVIARFEAERQALALMDHPNIAKVHDAGAADSGRLYFIMELVQGVPITRYCDEKRLTPRERLDLFIPVCQAIQHAYQKGIIHRDLKPSNVLVGIYDGRPVPKVIDFGVAKAAGPKLTEATLFTGFGTVIGTPEYMSPEQAMLDNVDIDTRSDIYSLGVLLYELLTGTTPFAKKDLEKAGMLEMLRVIREQEPTKPSTKLSTAKGLPTLAADRGMEPAKLTKLLRGELDWIVMKSLDKDRNRRYETAGALAADVRRYLADEPVQACPPSALYRFRKLARRNKALFMTASVIAVALLMAAVTLAVSGVLVWQAKDDLQVALERSRWDTYLHRITLAHRELLANNLGGALQLLGECPEALRGWEWHYLLRLCRVDPLTLRGAGKVHALSISADGRHLAAGNDDGTIGLFDLKTGAELPALRDHKRAVRSVAFHPRGTRLASASADGTVRVWDVATGQQVFPHWPGNRDMRAYGVAFSPDGRRLATNDADGSVVLYDMADGHELLRLPQHERMGVCVDFSPDGKLLVTGNWTGLLRVWNAETGDPLRTRQGHEMPISAAKFSPDGRRLATTGYDRLVKVWEMSKLLDPANHDEPRSWRGHDCIIVGLDFSPDPDGDRLAMIGGEDKTVKLWDARTGREILKLHDGRRSRPTVAFAS